MINELTSDRIEYLINRTKFTREKILYYYEIFRIRCQSSCLSKIEIHLKHIVNFYFKLLIVYQMMVLFNLMNILLRFIYIVIQVLHEKNLNGFIMRMIGMAMDLLIIMKSIK